MGGGYWRGWRSACVAGPLNGVIELWRESLKRIGVRGLTLPPHVCHNRGAGIRPAYLERVASDGK